MSSFLLYLPALPSLPLTQTHPAYRGTYPGSLLLPFLPQAQAGSISGGSSRQCDSTCAKNNKGACPKGGQQVCACACSCSCGRACVFVYMSKQATSPRSTEAALFMLITNPQALHCHAQRTADNRLPSCYTCTRRCVTLFSTWTSTLAALLLRRPAPQPPARPLPAPHPQARRLPARRPPAPRPPARPLPARPLPARPLPARRLPARPLPAPSHPAPSRPPRLARPLQAPPRRALARLAPTGETCSGLSRTPCMNSVSKKQVVCLAPRMRTLTACPLLCAPHSKVTLQDNPGGKWMGIAHLSRLDD